MKTLQPAEDTYIVGDTIVLRAEVFRGDSPNVSIDPTTVSISSFTFLGQNFGLGNYTFTRLIEGTWEIDLSSDNLGAGSYEYQIKVVGPLGITLLDDHLIIKAASVPVP